ncbi:hypothetical protein [Frateuria sp. Soil773]|uniref:hypothetical protein n=1 Tax=Frateuria sp. Soil773 TaxID=1736407 RepID=UPI0012F9752F|nr:hypothetical protein [Frateuria sp. Soil773]
MADIDLLLESKVEFCIVALRFDSEHKDTHLVRTVDIPLLSANGAAAPIAQHAPHNYYGPGIFLPACYPHAISRVSITESGKSKKTNSYLSVEQAHNLERSCFLRVGANNLHVDVIGSREDGLLILLYKRADDVTFDTKVGLQSIEVPYAPAPLQLATLERVDVKTKPGLAGRKVGILEQDVPRILL